MDNSLDSALVTIQGYLNAVLCKTVLPVCAAGLLLASDIGDVPFGSDTSSTTFQAVTLCEEYDSPSSTHEAVMSGADRTQIEAELHLAKRILQFARQDLSVEYVPYVTTLVETLDEEPTCAAQWIVLTNNLQSARTALLASVSYHHWVNLMEIIHPDDEDVAVPVRFIIQDEDDGYLDIDYDQLRIASFLRGPDAPQVI